MSIHCSKLVGTYHALLNKLSPVELQEIKRLNSLTLIPEHEEVQKEQQVNNTVSIDQLKPYSSEKIMGYSPNCSPPQTPSAKTPPDSSKMKLDLVSNKSLPQVSSASSYLQNQSISNGNVKETDDSSNQGNPNENVEETDHGSQEVVEDVAKMEKKKKSKTHVFPHLVGVKSNPEVLIREQQKQNIIDKKNEAFCSICGTSFSTRFALRRHILNKHPDSKIAKQEMKKKHDKEMRGTKKVSQVSDIPSRSKSCKRVHNEDSLSSAEDDQSNEVIDNRRKVKLAKTKPIHIPQVPTNIQNDQEKAKLKSKPKRTRPKNFGVVTGLRAKNAKMSAIKRASSTRGSSAKAKKAKVSKQSNKLIKISEDTDEEDYPSWNN